ncbi:CRE-ATG-16.2 protein [Aphelenchoides avenae]|nr:CRE-ATG-16.2 protein [Aphelenchus avenae]
MFTTSNQGVTRIDLDPECKHILGSSNDRAVRIWSIADQRQRHAFTGHTDKVSAAKFHAQGRQVVSGSHDRTIKIFDIGANRCESLLTVLHLACSIPGQKTLMPGSTVFDIASNDRFGIPIISGHFDKSIRFWDTRCDTHTNVVKMNGKVTSLSVSTDGQYLLCSSRDETLSLIDLRNYGIVHIYSAEQYRTSSDYSKCIISPGMKFVAAGSAEGHVFIWNLNTTKLEKVLYKGGHEGHAVLSISWHPSGHMLLTGDRRKTACIWR